MSTERRPTIEARIQRTINRLTKAAKRQAQTAEAYGSTDPATREWDETVAEYEQLLYDQIRIAIQEARAT